MMYPSIVHHRSCQGVSCQIYLPDTFGVLCWNVYKNNRKQQAFYPFLKSLVEENKIDLLFFQEANFKDSKSCMLSDFSFDAAANLEYRGKFFGVLTASKAESQRSQAYLTEGKESLILTHKSLLLSEFSFVDKSKLLVLNIHAINFRENKRYDYELDSLLVHVKDHQGPMIIAGDFNSWHKKRMQKLEEIKKILSLKTVTFKDKEKIKSFMGYPLDHIFYRGLELMDSAVIDGDNLSDHAPLFAKFKKI